MYLIVKVDNLYGGFFGYFFYVILYFLVGRVGVFYRYVVFFDCVWIFWI